MARDIHGTGPEPLATIPLLNKIISVWFLGLPYSGYTITALDSLAIGESVVDEVMGEGFKGLYCHISVWLVLEGRTAC